eukprot:g18372.t1
MLARRELAAEHMAQINSTPILGLSLTPYNLASGGYYSGSRDWEQLREDIAGEEGLNNEVDAWFYAKAKIQTCARRAVREYDAEQLLRRRELVGRSYKRCLNTSRLSPGMQVMVRRADGKFRHHEDGEVAAVPAQFKRGSRRMIDMDDDSDDEEEDERFMQDGEEGNLDGQRLWVGRTELKKLASMFLQEFLLDAGERTTSGDSIPLSDGSSEWIENDKTITLIHHQPRVARATPVSGAVTEQMAQEFLENKRKTYYIWNGDPLQQLDEEDNWRDSTVGHKPIYARRRWTGRTIFFKRPGAWGKRILPFTRKSDSSSSSSGRGDEYQGGLGMSEDSGESLQQRIQKSEERFRSIMKKVRNCVSTMELKVKDGQMYLNPAQQDVDATVAVQSHGVFGRTAMKSEVKDKNIMSSRLVVVIKIDLTTGLVSRVKSRWVSRGFEDRRFGKNKAENALQCRSYTMNEMSYTLLLQFCQATRSATWNGDVKEAFLEGMTFKEFHGDNDDYWSNPYSTVWMQVPPVIQQMKELGLLELVELVKCIYGCKDAPFLWQMSFHDVLRMLGLRQSMLDPCLWICLATPQEEEVLAKGEDAVTEYYNNQVKRIDEVDHLNTAGMADVILGMRHDQKPHFARNSDNSEFLNPETEKLATSLTMHIQARGTMLGAIGSHVDDTKSGGRLLFMLRLYALFRRFPLGSWSRVSPGSRDTLIGREEQCVPEVIDKHQTKQMLMEKADELAEYDVQVPDEFTAPTDEKEISRLEKKYNITRDQEPHTYEKAKNLTADAATLRDGHRMEEDVVYVVSQESYGSRIKTIDRAEVETFFRARDSARTKFQRKQVQNPFRGRVGELIWSTKTNSAISTTVSELASQMLRAEQADSWQQVQFYVNDISGIILFLQNTKTSMRRVSRVGDLFEHYLLGCGDASRSRVGGSLNVIGLQSDRFTTASTFTKVPKRVHNSSTGIETLTQRMLCSELLSAAQLAYDLHLVKIGSALLQVVDSQNCREKPLEVVIKRGSNYHCTGAAQWQHGRLFHLNLDLDTADVRVGGEMRTVPMSFVKVLTEVTGRELSDFEYHAGWILGFYQRGKECSPCCKSKVKKAKKKARYEPEGFSF